MSSIPAIVSGQLLIYAIYDVADEADLVKVERVVRARPSVDGERITRLQLERQRTSVTFANPPVTVRLGDRSLHLGEVDHAVTSYAKVYDFGALTVVWTVPIPPQTSLGRLAELASPRSKVLVDQDRLPRLEDVLAQAHDRPLVAREPDASLQAECRAHRPGIEIEDCDVDNLRVEDVARALAHQLVHRLGLELGSEATLDVIDDRQLRGAPVCLAQQALRLVEQARVLQRDTQTRR